jgi:Leucine carboxyl methyltransferase
MKDRLIYIEVDYYDVVEKKIQFIKKSEGLARHIWSTPEELQNQVPELELNTNHYKIIAGDLRETQKLKEKLTSFGVNPSSPTFILTECVLVYLKPDESLSILNFLRDHFSGDIALLNYEMINPHDPFGKVMLENLEVCSDFIIYLQL